jgi:hypothetical protein
METDAMQFLLEVRARLHDRAGQASTDDGISDLQAVDRTLPDTDWFEMEEVRDDVRESALSQKQKLEPPGRIPPHLEF